MLFRPIMIWGPRKNRAFAKKMNVFWGERSFSEYFLLKRSFGTCMRSLPAKKANMFNPLTGIRNNS